MLNAIASIQARGVCEGCRLTVVTLRTRNTSRTYRHDGNVYDIDVNVIMASDAHRVVNLPILDRSVRWECPACDTANGTFTA